MVRNLRKRAQWPLLLTLLILAGCSRQPQSGEVLDEARMAGRDPSLLIHASEDNSTTWMAHPRVRPKKSRVETCGWSGAEATIASGPA